MARLSFRCSEDLVGAVDLARGDVARERWLRRAVETALAEARFGPGAVGEFGTVERALGTPGGSSGSAARDDLREGAPVSAPAEQPEASEKWETARAVEPDLHRAALAGRAHANSGAPPAREFRPYPKPGKR